ncbi:hypothetical protein K501DRAFT_275059 [Backusella circina FSU 941]|nr:hypothetical protein K501DRAFT_275059 [Backusella circina FSU 941]
MPQQKPSSKSDYINISRQVTHISSTTPLLPFFTSSLKIRTNMHQEVSKEKTRRIGRKPIPQDYKTVSLCDSGYTYIFIPTSRFKKCEPTTILSANYTGRVATELVNHNMNNVDITDRYRPYYNTQKTSRRYWMPLFYWIYQRPRQIYSKPFMSHTLSKGCINSIGRTKRAFSSGGKSERSINNYDPGNIPRKKMTTSRSKLYFKNIFDFG